ncbi:MAG: CHAD domain-containing protein [Pseudomonadota bacterium]|uniref:CYTH and CHAD domain-containing protein n=1 Tax=Phenylobacterium sp. TaxID=1871053 RepID=UPI0025F58600|nr:CYTH and CHAD domain-containing protein [Phenylobacterium sp.]MBT9470972.1 CHAD domain-containing protein [Phenylobacterium sp.]
MSAGEDEIELKFLCEPADLAAVLAAAPVGETHEKTLVSTYFDTPQGDLRRARISLRIREGGAKRVQTLKRGDGFARQEHEQSIEGIGLDLSLAALKDALPAAKRATLAPIFTVRVVRRQRTFDYGGATIEMAVDEGEVQAGERTRRISEVELELKAGVCDPMFELARQLSKTAPLYLSFDGKASQGQGLIDGTDRAPRRHDKAPLARGLSAAGAFQAIARNTLVQIAANGVVLRQADSVEAVHQLRVAVRRLRSTISTFKTIVDDERTDDIASELKWLAGACDEARDFDVFAADLAKFDDPALDLSPLLAAVEAARARGHAKACAAVASGRFRELVLETTAWVETGAWLTQGGKASAKRRDMPAERFAAKALERRRKTLLKRGADLEGQDDAARHEARIAAKKLRYAAEAFVALFEPEPAKVFIKDLRRLQDQLGLMNDAAVAGALVERLKLKGKALAAARQLIALRDAAKPKTAKASAKAMGQVLAAPAFWIG